MTRKEKVLIIDDEEVVCENLRISLEEAGFQVETVTSGEEALESLKGKTFDLIVVDIRLQGRVNGLDVIKAAGKLSPRPRIAAISATPYHDLKPIFDEQHVSRVIDRVLEKPEDALPDTFVEIVIDLLKTPRHDQLHMENKPGTILIVDDDKTIIEQLVSHFRRRGFEPIATADPTIVEQTLNNFTVHLILLDLRMERLSGYEVLKKVRERKTAIPVLIFTAYYEEEKERLRSAGICQEDVIQKPFTDFSVIEARINEKLNRLVMPVEVASDYEDKIYLENRTKIVLVDDETQLTDMLKDVLLPRNYQVKIFETGKDALPYVLNEECHILVMDMRIPGISGDRVIEEVIAKKPRVKIIPISGAYSDEIRRQLEAIGLDGKKLLTKPFSIEVFIERVKALAIEAGTLGGEPTLKLN